MTRTVPEAKLYLESIGFVIGARDPRLGVPYEGAFMASQPYEEDEFPIASGTGPWVVVGDDLDGIIMDAYEAFEPEDWP